MRKIITVLVLLLITVSTFAQQGINYKALLKDESGNVLVNANTISVQFTIYEGGTLNNPVYLETHTNMSTDANGIIILNIGNGTTTDVFTDIVWGNDEHWLNVQIDIGAGLIDMGTTQFMAVPYAKHAEIAENVFSGDYNDLTNQPAIPRGLEQITEDGNTGWRLVGVDPNNYGPIGSNAKDFSYSDAPSSTRGATGNYSTAMGRSIEATGNNSTAIGRSTEASGYNSTAMGSSTEASGDYTTAMGVVTTASSYAETAIGIFSTDYTPMSPNFWYENDRIFNIGNGYSNQNRSDALTVLKNGTITAPSVTNSLINTAGNKALITKEYADTNYLMTNGSVDISINGELQQTSTGTANLVPIAYGIVESTGSVLSGTGNFTAFLSGNVFIIDVNGTESLNYSNTVAIITPISTSARTSTTILSDGNGDSDLDLNVRIFTASGTQVTTTFQFVIYKL